MMKLLKFSTRNVLRNKRRSMLTLLIFIVSFQVLSLLRGYIATQRTGWRELLIHNEYGHFQIFNKAYKPSESTSFKSLISDLEYKELSQLLSDVGGVKFFSPRLNFSGLIGGGKVNTQIFIGSGRSPEEADRMYYGSPVVEGAWLSDNHPNGILFGQQFAENMGLTIGDSVLVMGTSAHGSIEAVNVTVRGLLKTNSQLDSMGTIMRTQDVKEMFLANGYHSVAVLLQSESLLGSVLAKLKTLFKSKDLPLKILSFEQMATFYGQVTQMYERYFWVSILVLSILIVFSLTNTIYMSITERMKEFAVLRTIGIYRRTIFMSIVIEGFLLGFAGSAIGLALSFGLHSLINSAGLTLPPPPGSSDRIPFIVVFSWMQNVYIGLIFLAVSALASILPAAKVVRMEILKGLRAFLIPAIVLVCYSTPLFASEFTLSPESIRQHLKRSENILDRYSYVTSLTQFENGTPSRKVTLLILVAGENSLAYYLEPAQDKGKTVLQKGSNYFLYFPKPKQYLRISPQLAVFNSLSYADLVKPPLTKYYDLKAHQSSQNSDSKIELEFVLKPEIENFPYYRRIVEYDKAEEKIRSIASYSRSGVLLGKMENTQFHLLDGLFFPKIAKLWDVRNQENYSIQENVSIQKRSLDPFYFTPGALRDIERAIKNLFPEL